MSKRSFEEALRALEEIVEALEAGGTSLDEALDLFERGIGASRECTEILSAARKRVQKLVEDREGAFRLEMLDVDLEPERNGGN